MSRQATLDQKLKRSYENLRAARDAAAQKRGYKSEEARENLRKVFTERFGSVPHTWQVDVSEALLLGLDSVVIAGTGAGKTMPFMMPLLYDPSKVVIILSPLNILEYDMACRFEKMGIAATPVNKDTWSDKLLQEMKDMKHRALLMSPEMALENPALRQLLGSKTYQEKIAAVIVDECHCISQWGGEFRPKYSALEKFRAFVPTHIPFLATSATLPPSALDEVSTKLNIDLTSSFFLNLGNDRPNITPKVIQIKSTDDYEALKKLVKDGVITPDDLEKTIIYVDGVNATQHLVREIRTWFPASFHDYIDCLNSRRTPFAKTTVMDRFRRGLVRILVATEAAGMGADIPDITRVIQFGLCKSLSIWTQRAGRAGRSPGLHATAYLLVQKSMFKRRKRKKGEAADTAVLVVNVEAESEKSDMDESDTEKETARSSAALADDGKVWGRKVEEPFRKWIQALGCRRDVSDEYFDSPGPRKHPTGACCDNCVQAAANNEPSHDSDDGSDEDESDTTSSADSSSASDSDNDTVNANGKRTIRSREKGARKRCATGPKRAGKRRGQHLQDVRAALETWRYRKKRDEYTPSSFGASALLPDLILTALASNTSLNTVDDLSSLKIPWMFAKKHGDEVLDIVRRVDTARKQVLDSAKIEKREKKKRETAERNERKRQEKLAMTALKKAQRGTVRAPLPPAALPSSPFFFTGPSLPFHAQSQHSGHVPSLAPSETSPSSPALALMGVMTRPFLHLRTRPGTSFWDLPKSLSRSFRPRFDPSSIPDP